MQGTSIKPFVLSALFASALPLAACGDSKNNNNTTTAPGPTVTTPTSPTTTTPPAPAPEPTPAPAPAPTPTPTPTPANNQTTLTGQVANLTRSGAGDLDITFRINDNTIVRAAGTTPVTSGSLSGRTDFIRNGQTVTATGTMNGGFLDATSLTIVAQAP